MKPLVLLLLVLASPPLRAQSDSADKLDTLKQRYGKGGQRPDAGAGAGGGPAPARAPELSIADLEAILLASPECRKNPDDTKDLASNLKGKYGIIACNDPILGLRQVILVPKSASPNQQLVYASVAGYKLLRARFFDHYLVLQFDKQTQYLDLLKQAKDGDKDAGFAFSGVISDKRIEQFADSRAFVDGLKNYMGIAEGSEDSVAFAAIPARVEKNVSGNPFRLTGAFAKGKLIVVVTTGGETFMIWPNVARPKP